MTLGEIEGALLAAGFSSRGAFSPDSGDDVPLLEDGRRARIVVLAGNVGPHMWRSFTAARGASGMTLDAWSKQVLSQVAARIEARALFPFERPYVPFQRWAMRAEACHPSPVGMLIHPDYGLWHGYRGALLIGEELELAPSDRRASPCASCVGKPCLFACPAGAFSAAGYDVPVCTRHLARTPEPECMRIGCMARHACPVGQDYRYAPEQAHFHMRAFLQTHGGAR